MFGRFIPEIIRIIQALQVADCSNASTPANWMPNQPLIVPAPQTQKEMEERIKSIEQNSNGLSWYLSLKNVPEKCEKEIDAQNE